MPSPPSESLRSLIPMIDTTNAYAPTSVSPPGETLRELLEDRQFSQTDLAARMGRPQKTISEIINGKAAITPETALQLALVTGVPADFWNARERNYRSFLAQRQETERLQKLKAWCQRFPLKEMVKLRWLPPADDVAGCARNLLTFFGVAAPEQWDSIFGEYAVQFRRSSRLAIDKPSLSAWLRRGELQAAATDTQAYDAEAFVRALHKVRTLTREEPRVFQPTLIAICAEAGVAVAFVPELPKSSVSGATRWLWPSKPVIQLSLRYKTDDQLWFTFFHEAAHILLHGKRLIFLEDHASSFSVEEKQANDWAAHFLIDAQEYAAFVSAGNLDVPAIRAFADDQQIAPGIVVGRLQHDQALPYSKGNSLKVRLAWVAEN